jgi:response regulator NasT
MQRQEADSMHPTETENPTKARILVVDDDRLILAMLGEGLRKNGYSVIICSSGEGALRQCENDPPDLAILDVRMPGLSGVETARLLRERSSVPYMFLSAHGDTEIVKSAVDEGALGYLLKPVDVPQVIPTIEAALARAKELQSLQEREAQLNKALEAGRESSVAVGILMERYRLDRHAAFDLLRSHARAQNRKILDVGTDLVEFAEGLNLPTETLNRTRKGK